MKGRILLPTLIALTLAAPAAGAQTLLERLGDLEFADVVITVAPNAITIEAVDAVVGGATAQDLRKCIDGLGCPQSELDQVSPGNEDGEVSPEEVADFERVARSLLNLAKGQLGAFTGIVLSLATIDGVAANDLSFETINFDNAEGRTNSNSPIKIDFAVRLHFDDVDGADSHDVLIQRTSADFELFKRITLEPGSGWRIDADSIEPAEMQGRFDEDRQRFTGSQAELQGTAPLAFTLESTGATDLGWWLLALSVLLLAGALYAFWKARQKRAKA